MFVAARSHLRKSLFYRLLGGQKTPTYRLRGKYRRRDRIYYRPRKVRMPLYDLCQFPSESKVIINEENGRFSWSIPIDERGR